MQVTIYTKPGCVQCDATIRMFNAIMVEPEVVNLEERPELAASLKSDGWKQLPVVEIDGEPKWTGFRPDLIKQL